MRDKGVTSARPTVAMTPFAACYRSINPLLDAAVSQLRGSTESFWVVTPADIWPGAVPTIDFGSDQSDVEVDEEDAAHNASALLQSKRKASKDATSAA